MVNHLTIRPMTVAPVPRLALRDPEAAESLGVSASWLRREALSGRVPSVLITGVRLYPVAQLASWLTEEAVKEGLARESDMGRRRG
jgi:hypothetical protein